MKMKRIMSAMLVSAMLVGLGCGAMPNEVKSADESVFGGKLYQAKSIDEVNEVLKKAAEKRQKYVLYDILDYETNSVEDSEGAAEESSVATKSSSR